MADLKWLLKTITFNDSQTITVNNGDIVVFVGPNNAGKSQSLRDIYHICGNGSSGVVISGIEHDKIPCDDPDRWFSSFCKPSNTTRDGTSYVFMDARINTSWVDLFYSSDSFNTNFQKILISFMKTEDRLSLVSPPPLLNNDEPRSHPIQIVKDNPEKKERLSEYFYRAFGHKLFPSVETKEISLVLGSIDRIENQENLSPVQIVEELRSIQSTMPFLENQGDGMRSFTGILLNLLMPNYSMFLLDEPESFLHPPQAYILGGILPDMIPTDKQAFIATHSQDLLKGLIDKCPKRVKIIRVTRANGINPVKLLDNKVLSELWKDSFMKYSNILDSLFHESVVLCESDSDCKIYSMVLDDLKEEQGRTGNTLFTYCGGKRRYPVVATMLKTLGVDFRIIPDLDFLNDRDLVKSVYEICGGMWDKSMDSLYNTIKSSVESLDSSFKLKDLKEYCQNYFDKKGAPDTQDISKKELTNFKNGIKYPRGWDLVKEGGVSMIRKGEATKAFYEIDEKLKNVGIFMPHVGELENFFRQYGHHGPKWAAEVMERYHDMPNNEKEQIKSFISSLSL